MRYMLSREYAMRRWKNTDIVLMNLDSRKMTGLDLFSYLFLSQCDGLTEIDENNERLARFLESNVVVPWDGRASIREEQRLKTYPNEYFPIVQWAITNRCNYTCKHCFMASSMEHETAEPTHEQCMDIIDQFEACGIRNIYLTGGEPLLRDDFLSIVDALVKKDVHIDIISTNGALVNEALLMKIKERGIRPAFAISYDGIGRHDWLRGVKGAEEASIRAVKLLVDHGFPVMVEMAVHKGNADIVIETHDFMHTLGVDTVKTIRVAESPRWKETGLENHLTPEAYYDVVTDLLKAHIDNNWQMNSKIIGFAHYLFKDKRCEILPMKGIKSDTDNTVLCKKARSIVFISGDGRLLPCNPFNGMTSGKEDWGNVYNAPLSSLLTQSAYLEKVNARVGMLKDRDKKCRTCQWMKYCLGGCRACAYAATQDYLSGDPTKCAFFEGGYPEKIRKIVGAAHCTQEF